MTENERQIFAHLNMLEFMLEALMATLLAGVPQEPADLSMKDMLIGMKRTAIPPDAADFDADEMLKVLHDASKLAERFLQRVKRQADLRRLASTGQ